MARYTADVRIEVTVEFDDDGESALVDQAIDAAYDLSLSRHEHDAEVVGQVKEIQPKENG